MLLLNFYFFIILLFSSLYSTRSFNSVGNVIIAGLIFLFIPLMVITKKRTIRLPKNLIILFYFYLVSAAMSTFVNLDMVLLINALVVCMLFFVSTSGVGSFKVDPNELIYKNSLRSQLPLLFVPLLLNGINSTPYRGIFYNPNSFGSVAATVFAISLAPFLYKMERHFFGPKDKKLKIKRHFFLLSLLLFLVIISGSRTSALTVVGVSLVGFFYFFRNLIKQKKAKMFLKTITRISFYSVIVVTIARFTPFYGFLQDNIINKFILKSSRGDVLDQRGSVWRQTIREAGFFGNGGDYFLTQTQVGAHSTYFSILGEYGWITFILFSLILLVMLRKTIRYLKMPEDNSYKYLPLLVTVSFLLLSFAEGMMFKLSMIAMFFLVGGIMHNQTEIAHSKK